MAASVAVFKNAKVYLGAYELTGQTNDVKVEYSVEELVKNCLGDGTALKHPGLMQVKANVTAYWQAGSNPQGLVKTFYDSVGVETPVPLSVGPLAGADGEPALTFRAGLFSFGQPMSHGQIAKMETAFSPVASRLVDGTILLPSAARTAAAGTGTGRQLGALAANQTLFVAMHVLAFTGTTLTLAVESDDAGAFASPQQRVTSVAFAGIGSDWQELNGPVTDVWWRAKWTFTGTSFTALLIAGVLSK